MNDNHLLEFVDTNILVYAYNSDDLQKQTIARSLILSLWTLNKGALSIQVLQEFYVVITQKFSNSISPENTIQIIKDLGKWKCFMPKIESLINAIHIQQRNKLSFWDAMIIYSAKELGCNIIWTEDLNHNQLYEGIKVINPFIN